MSPLTLGRLALAGTRTDVLRAVLTAVSAGLSTVAVLAAATVLSIPGSARHYTNNLLVEAGLRSGVATALALLCIPVLALAGQCARLGAPARDRRLAAVRLAGATPRQTAAIAAAEASVAAAVGAVLGLAAFFMGRRELHRPTADGWLPLPTDVLPPAWTLATVGVGIPLLVGLFTVVQLRRVTLSPMGVLRRVPRQRAPRPWPGLLVLAGLAACLGVQPYLEWKTRRNQELDDGVMLWLVFGGALLASVGIMLGAGWISYQTGRVLGRFARRPSSLIAARRLTSDPWAGSRTFAALLACLVFAGGGAGFRAYFTTLTAQQVDNQRRLDAALGQRSPSLPVDDFYLRTMNLVDSAVRAAAVIAAVGLLIAIAENVFSRRRANTALVATGVPRTSLGASLVWQILTPTVPATLLALTVGALAARGLLGREVSVGAGEATICTVDDPVLCADPAYERRIEIPAVIDAVPVPLGDLAAVWGIAAAAVLAVIGIGLLTLRTSTAIEELRTT